MFKTYPFTKSAEYAKIETLMSLFITHDIQQKERKKIKKKDRKKKERNNENIYTDITKWRFNFEGYESSQFPIYRIKNWFKSYYEDNGR